MDIAAADDSTLTAVENKLAAIEARTDHTSRSANTANPLTTSSTSTDGTVPSAVPLTSKYSYTVCERCHKLGHTAQQCTSTHTIQHNKKKQPSLPQSQPPRQQPAATHEQTQPLPSHQPTAMPPATDDEDAAAMIQQLSIAATTTPNTAINTSAAIRVSPYGEHMLPLCYMCEQRHDFGECRKTRK